MGLDTPVVFAVKYVYYIRILLIWVSINVVSTPPDEYDRKVKN